MDLFLAIILTSIAGLSTGIGGALATFTKKTNKTFLSVSLGFSAGIMIYLSLTEIFAEAKELLTASLNERRGAVIAVCCFFAGIFIIGIIDRLIPHGHEAGGEKSDEERHEKHPGLMRTGVFTALSLVIHNIPEGIAMFISIMEQPSASLPLVIAVIIHNIPAGIAVSVPIYYATGNKRKSFLYSLVTGLSQPVAAIVGYLLLSPFLNDIMFGILYALVAGFMLFIALDDLLPAALSRGGHHHAIYGLVGGMAVMAICLLLFM